MLQKGFVKNRQGSFRCLTGVGKVPRKILHSLQNVEGDSDPQFMKSGCGVGWGK